MRYSRQENGLFVRLAEPVAFLRVIGLPPAAGRKKFGTFVLSCAGELVALRQHLAGAGVAQRLVEVGAEGEVVLHRKDDAGEGELDALAVVRERGALDVGERAARREDLLLEVVAAFDREFGLSQDRQAGRIGLRGRRVVGQAEERAAHAERAGAGIAEVELQAGERLDVGVLRERAAARSTRRTREGRAVCA